MLPAVILSYCTVLAVHLPQCYLWSQDLKNLCLPWNAIACGKKLRPGKCPQFVCVIPDSFEIGERLCLTSLRLISASAEKTFHVINNNDTISAAAAAVDTAAAAAAVPAAPAAAGAAAAAAAAAAVANSAATFTASAAGVAAWVVNDSIWREEREAASDVVATATADALAASTAATDIAAAADRPPDVAAVTPAPSPAFATNNVEPQKNVSSPDNNVLTNRNAPQDVPFDNDKSTPIILHSNTQLSAFLQSCKCY